MKRKQIILLLVILICSSFSISAKDTPEIISLYKGSKQIFDDNIGFETFYYLYDKSTMKTIEGNIRRQFCSAPKGISPYEIIKNYEKAITAKSGKVIHLSRDAYRFTDTKTGKRVYFMSNFFTHKRLNRTNHWGYLQLPSKAEDYVVGKVSTASNDIFISVAAANIDNLTYYTLVTVLVKPMDLNNVTLNAINEGIAANGKLAIYDIYFDTGKSEVKSESSSALKVIADYLNNNSSKKFLIVGHTDNTGDFNANIELSTDRAKAVCNKLISEYKINKEIIKPFGVGSSSPKTSNSTSSGKSRNRRVELVEF